MKTSLCKTLYPIGIVILLGLTVTILSLIASNLANKTSFLIACYLLWLLALWSHMSKRRPLDLGTRISLAAMGIEARRPREALRARISLAGWGLGVVLVTLLLLCPLPEPLEPVDRGLILACYFFVLIGVEALIEGLAKKQEKRAQTRWIEKVRGLTEDVRLEGWGSLEHLLKILEPGERERVLDELSQMPQGTRSLNQAIEAVIPRENRTQISAEVLEAEQAQAARERDRDRRNQARWWCVPWVVGFFAGRLFCPWLPESETLLPHGFISSLIGFELSALTVYLATTRPQAWWIWQGLVLAASAGGVLGLWQVGTGEGIVIVVGLLWGAVFGTGLVMAYLRKVGRGEPSRSSPPCGESQGT